MSQSPPGSGPACPECAAARTEGRPGVLLGRGAFVVHPRPEFSPVPGWLVVAPVRHVEQIDTLTPEEQRALGPLLSEVAAALRAETPCEKVYVSVFAEVLPHFHVHVIARPPGLPEGERGARIFASERRADEAERAALFRRVQLRLDSRRNVVGKKRPAGPWRAVLLSAVVGPGVGQLAQKRILPGLALLGTTLALVGMLFVRVFQEASARMPADPSGLDPLFAFGLATEIQKANASFFGWITAGLVVLWVIGIADAWRAQR